MMSMLRMGRDYRRVAPSFMLVAGVPPVPTCLPRWAFPELSEEEYLEMWSGYLRELDDFWLAIGERN